MLMRCAAPMPSLSLSHANWHSGMLHGTQRRMYNMLMAWHAGHTQLGEARRDAPGRTAATTKVPCLQYVTFLGSLLICSGE